MPTYDYRCATCGVEFELLQSFSEDALKKCPTKKSGNSPAGCTSPGRGKVEKVFSAPGITFKGSGFYKTDSRSGSKKTTSTGDSGSSDTKSGDTKSGDSKSGESSTSETKSGDSKPSESSTSETKSGDSKSGSTSGSSSTTPKSTD